MPIKEFYLDRVLSDIGITHEQFIDLCILLGCDYCDSIRGIGPKRAIELIKQYKSIDEVIKHIDLKVAILYERDYFQKYPLPENWMYKEARELFINPEVTEGKDMDLKWLEPEEDELMKFMVEQNGFNEDRIRNGCKKLSKARNVTTQGRLDNFFKVSALNSTTKRKPEETKGSAKKKQKTGGFKRGR